MLLSSRSVLECAQSSAVLTLCHSNPVAQFIGLMPLAMLDGASLPRLLQFLRVEGMLSHPPAFLLRQQQNTAGLVSSGEDAEGCVLILQDDA